MRNTGKKIAQNLEQYIVSTGQPTGNIKSNNTSDPDYEDEINDTSLCPLPFVAELSVTPMTITVSGENLTTASFSIQSNTTWEIPTEDRFWTNPSKRSGSGNDTLVFTLGKNSNLVDRVHFFGIETTSGSASGEVSVRDIKITQLKLLPFDVNPKSISNNYNPFSQTITVDGGYTWSINSLPFWLTSSQGSSGTGNFILSATRNTNSISRSWNVGVTGNGTTETISVSQGANPDTLAFNPTSEVVTARTTSYSLEIQSNNSWTLSTPLSSNWITLSQENGLLTQTITVSFSQNASTTNSRTATINAESANGVTTQHTLTQNQAPPTPTSYSFNVLRAGNETNACAGFGTNVVVWSSSNNPSTGDTLYTDENLQFPVSSFDRYYKTQLGTVYVVNLSGEITLLRICGGMSGDGSTEIT